jgi:cytochrome c oxidase cbb3-type subunit III
VCANDSSPEQPISSDANPAVSGLILLALLGLVLAGFVAFRMLSKPVGPPPPEVARDSLLTQGRAIYLARCVTCHGTDGRGDGPIAGSLIGPPVGNLSVEHWKHGDRSEQVLQVIGAGVASTRMQGFATVLDPPELRAVAAYVYYLARRPVPEELRRP